MNKPILWYKWSENREEGLVPWYVALRRLTFWPFMFVSVCFAYVFIMGGWGVKEANRIWQEIF